MSATPRRLKPKSRLPTEVRATLLQNRKGRVYAALDGELAAPPLCALYYPEHDVIALLLADRSLVELARDIADEFIAAFKVQETFLLIPFDKGLSRAAVPLVIR